MRVCVLSTIAMHTPYCRGLGRHFNKGGLPIRSHEHPKLENKKPREPRKGNMGETWDIMFKVIIIGDTGTGKVYACVHVFKWVCLFVYVCVRESESVCLCLFAVILVFSFYMVYVYKCVSLLLYLKTFLLQTPARHYECMCVHVCSSLSVSVAVVLMHGQVYIYIYIYNIVYKLYTYIHTCICIYMYVYTCIYMYVYKYIHAIQTQKK